MDDRNRQDTRGGSYTQRLETRSGGRWKRLLNVQAPYQWNLRRQALGKTLDIGCGIGRNLVALPPGSVGVDHNQSSVESTRARGLSAYTWDEFQQSPLARPESFDGILLAHVIEHMTRPEAVTLLQAYLVYLRPGGRAFFVCPQERGFATDDTHVEFASGEDLESIARRVGLEPEGWYSFPFPRVVGRVFPYNEFCLRSTKPA